MRLLGIALVILGIFALMRSGNGYDPRTTIVDVGDIKATTTNHMTIPMAPIAGATAVIGGIVLLVVPKRRLA